ncbi:MAG: hypothetical protein ACE5JS_20195, partial [Nitrospinota bacterium]
LAKPKLFLPQFGKRDHWFRAKYKEGQFDFFPSVRLFKLSRSRLIKKKYDIVKKGVFDDRSVAFKVTVQIFDQFWKRALSNDSMPIILLLPNRLDVSRYWRDKTAIYGPLLKYFKRKGYEYVDAIGAFEANEGKANTKDLFAPYHYSPKGNELVGKYILNHLRRRNLMDLNAVRRRVREQRSTRVGQKE